MGLTTIEASLTYNLQQPIASTRDRLWGNALTADVYAANPAFLVETPPLDHHFISCVRAGMGKLNQTQDGRTSSALARKGHVFVMPSRRAATWFGHTPQHVRMRITEKMLSDTWEECGHLPSRSVELLSTYAKTDLFLSRIAETLAVELMFPIHPAQRLIAEAATCMVMTHLVRNHCGFSLKSEQKVGPISTAVVRKIEEYIRENLKQPITLDDLANIAGISRFHFCRAFRVKVGISPMRYVEQVRIQHARDLLSMAELSVKEVAELVGFHNAAYFARRFEMLVQCSPSVFACEKSAATS